MATQFDIVSWVNENRKKSVLPSAVITLLLVVVAIFFGWGYWLLVPIPFAIVVFLYGFHIISETGMGYKVVLGKMDDKSYAPGWYWVIPFLGSMTEIETSNMCTVTVKDNVMKNADRREITFDYTLTWYLVPENVHLLHKRLGENEYVKKALLPQLDMAFSSIIMGTTYSDFGGNDTEEATDPTATPAADPAAAPAAPAATPVAPAAPASTTPTAEPTTESKDKLTQVVKDVLAVFENKYDHTFFKDVDLNITNLRFDAAYEKGKSDLAKAEVDVQIAEKNNNIRIQNAKAAAQEAEIQATGKAKALDIEGEAQANYVVRIKSAEAEGKKKHGEVENEVLEKRGKVLRDNPSIIRERQAEHTPKVLVNGNGGGVMPMVNVDSFVDHDLVGK